MASAEAGTEEGADLFIRHRLVNEMEVEQPRRVGDRRVPLVAGCRDHEHSAAVGVAQSFDQLVGWGFVSIRQKDYVTRHRLSSGAPAGGH